MRPINYFAITLFNLTLALTYVWAAPPNEEALGQASESIGKLSDAVAHYLNALQNAPPEDDKRIREKIIVLVRELRQKDPHAAGLPEAAQKHLQRAQSFSILAKDNAGLNDAIAEFQTALRIAPWWSHGYRELATVQEKIGQLDGAIQSLNWYLLSVPRARDANDVQKKIEDLTAKIEFAQKQRERQEAERKAAELRELEAKKPQGPCDLSGVWISTYGPMELTHTANIVKGRYQYNTYQGTIEGTVTGAMVNWQWSQTNNDRGFGRWSIVADCKNLHGQWGRGQNLNSWFPQGEWNATKK